MSQLAAERGLPPRRRPSRSCLRPRLRRPRRGGGAPRRPAGRAPGRPSRAGACRRRPRREPRGGRPAGALRVPRADPRRASAPAGSPPPTIATTRPRPCSSGCSSAAASRGWPASGRSTARWCGRCSRSPARRLAGRRRGGGARGGRRSHQPRPRRAAQPGAPPAAARARRGRSGDRRSGSPGWRPAPAAAAPALDRVSSGRLAGAMPVEGRDRGRPRGLRGPARQRLPPFALAWLHRQAGAPYPASEAARGGAAAPARPAAGARPATAATAGAGRPPATGCSCAVRRRAGAGRGISLILLRFRESWRSRRSPSGCASPAAPSSPGCSRGRPTARGSRSP